MIIKRKQDGQKFDTPDGPLPEGFEMVTPPMPTNAQKPPGVFGIPGARYLQPGEQAQSMPGIGQTIGQNVRQNWPGILGTVAGGMLPGGGAITGPLMRSGANALVTGTGRALQGDPNAAQTGLIAGGTQLAGEGLLGGALAGLQGVFRSNLGKRMASGLADYLRANVPALKNVKTLKQMILNQGPVDAVHGEYDQALKGMIAQIQHDNDLVIPKMLAQSLDIPIKGAINTPATPAIGRVPLEMVAVNPADAVASTVGKWKRDPKAYGQMSDILEQAGYVNPASKAYKTWSGIRDLLDKTGAIEGNTFNPEKAQAGLSDFNTASGLLRRGMQADVANILLPNGTLPIEKGNHKLSGALLGGGLGATLGGPLGPVGHGVGGVGGMYLGSHIGQAIPGYSNVIPPGLAAAQGPLAAGMSGLATNALSPLTITPPNTEAEARAAQAAIDAETAARRETFVPETPQ